MNTQASVFLSMPRGQGSAEVLGTRPCLPTLLGRGGSSRTQADSQLCLSKPTSTCPVVFWSYTANLPGDLI